MQRLPKLYVRKWKNKVNQKEKNKYHILMHIYGIYKDDTDETICRAAMETQT